MYIPPASPLENYAYWQRKVAEPKSYVIRTKYSTYFPSEN
jgi:hypothetical protein